MKKIWKKLISVTLALTMIVSTGGIGMNVYAASDAQQYKEVEAMRSLFDDSKIYVYATHNGTDFGGTIERTGDNLVETTFPSGSGARQMTATANAGWVFDGWTTLISRTGLTSLTSYSQENKENALGQYVFSNSHQYSKWDEKYDGEGATISANRTTELLGTVARPDVYELWANFNPTITATDGTNGAITYSGVSAGGVAEIEYGKDSGIYTITANAGYVISNVLVDGQSVAQPNTASYQYTFQTVIAPHAITFETTEVYDITFNPDGGTFTTPATPSLTVGNYIATTDVDGKINPFPEVEKSGHTFVAWVESPAVVPAPTYDANYTFTANTELTATWLKDAVTPTTYAVTVNGGAGGGDYAEAATVTITANAPESGKVFDGWTVNAGNIALTDASASETTFVMPAEAVEVTATYVDDTTTPTPTGLEYFWFGEYPQTLVGSGKMTYAGGVYDIGYTGTDEVKAFVTSPLPAPGSQNGGDGSTSYYRYDPIKWAVLETSNNLDGSTTYTLFSTNVIAAHEYDDTYDSGSWYNNGAPWSGSTIRLWLNADTPWDDTTSDEFHQAYPYFYGTAFGQFERGLIEPVQTKNTFIDRNWNYSETDISSETDFVSYLTYEQFQKLDSNSQKTVLTDYTELKGLSHSFDVETWLLNTVRQPTSSSYSVVAYKDGAENNVAIYSAPNMADYGVRPVVTITVPANYSIINAGTFEDPYSIVQTYSLSYAGGDGTEVDESYSENALVTLADTPVRAGYTFDGWDDGTTTHQASSGFTMPAENVVMTAVWTPIVYTIDYDLDGGTNSANNPYTFTADTELIVLEDATKTGYDFIAWVDYTTTEVTEIPKGTVGNISLTATWSANSGTAYTVIHETEDLTGGGYTEVDRDVLYGTTGEPVTPALKSYAGFTAPTAQTEEILADGSLEITYQYARNTYAVTFDADGGTPEPPVQNVKYEDFATEPADAMSRSGYTFRFWSADGSTEYDFTAEVKDAITLTALWSQNSSGGSSTSYYTSILADTDNGSAELSSTRNKLNATVTVTADPDDGYEVDSVVVTYGTSRTVSVTDNENGTYTYKQPGATATVTVTFIRVTDEDATDANLNRDDHMAYMKGYTDGTFGPSNDITRAEATVMFSRLLTNDIPEDLDEINFTDMTGDEWYADAVAVMTYFGIVTGYVDGTFGGDKPITRAEFATIASRFDALAECEEVVFIDVPETYWAFSYISSAAEKGWICGYTDNTFRPDQFITRAEAVTLVNRVLDRTADLDFIQEHLDDLLTFTDVDDTHWAYGAILEAANGHDYRKVNGEETWTSLD